MTEMLSIQSGVPKPARQTKAPRRKYPLEEMEVGQFLFYPGSNSRYVSSYVSRAAKDMLQVFSTKHCWAVRRRGAWKLVDEAFPGAIEGTGIWRDA